MHSPQVVLIQLVQSGLTIFPWYRSPMFALVEDRQLKIVTFIEGIGILTLPTLVSGLLVAPLIAAVGPNGKMIDYFYLAPTYLLPIIVGAVFGHLAATGKRPHSKILYFVFLIPMTMMLLDYVWQGSPSPLETFRKHFVPGYEYDEGLSRLLEIAPMFGSASYAISRQWSASRIKRRLKAENRSVSVS
jgi:hypothetical protein